MYHYCHFTLMNKIMKMLFPESSMSIDPGGNLQAMRRRRRRRRRSRGEEEEVEEEEEMEEERDSTSTCSTVLGIFFLHRVIDASVLGI